MTIEAWPRSASLGRGRGGSEPTNGSVEAVGHLCLAVAVGAPAQSVPGDQHAAGVGASGADSDEVAAERCLAGAVGAPADHLSAGADAAGVGAAGADRSERA